MVCAGRGFGLALFLDRAIQRMATVRHLGLFPWCLFRDEEHLRKTYSYLSNDDWQDNQKYFKNFETSVEIALVLYWRVKQWKISATQIVVLPDETNVEIPLEFTFTRNCKSEKELVCKETSGSLFFVKPLTTESDTIVTFVSESVGEYEASCSFQIPAVGILQGVAKTTPFGGHFSEDKTKIWTHLDFEIFTALAGGDFDASSATLNYSEGAEEHFAELKLLNQTIQWSYFLNQFNAEEGLGSISAFSNLTIEATEYWEYDPLDDPGPIYDKITGQQLRAFPQ
jgi:hypothetical protein